MSTATHAVAPEEIMALLDGELPADRAQSVSSHLQSCSECTAAITELRAASGQLKGWIVGEVPARVTNSVAAVQTQSSAKLPSRVSRSRYSLLLWGSGVAAALALFGVATPNLMRSKMAANEAAAIGRERAVRQNQAVDLARVNTGDTRRSSASVALNESEGHKLSDALVVDGSLAAPAARPMPPAAAHHGRLQGRAFQELAEVVSGPMIARTVSLSIIAKDFDAARNSLDAILARHNGYSATLTVSTPQGAAKSLQASLRIPAPQLAVALNELKSLGRVENESQNGEEVTQQHGDLVARLKNSRETEQRLQAILTQRTGKISDVLEVEQEIARVRGEIEQMEAEQKNLEHRVDFATVDLKISEEYKAQLNSPAPAVSTLIHNALVNGYRNVADTLLSLVLFFAEYGPVLLLWCVFLTVPGYLVWRRWRAAMASA